MRKVFGTTFLLALLTLQLLPAAALAQDGARSVLEGASQAATHGGLDVTQTDLSVAIGRTINALFGIIGVILLTVTLIGGYIWMTAGGNEEKVSKAKMFISNGINGMIVIFLSYALVWAILQALGGAVGSQ